MHLRHHLLAGLCLAACTIPADAATWVVTYQGTLGTTEVEDASGGIMTDPSLTGTAFTATFTVDESRGALFVEADGIVLEGHGLDAPVQGTLTFGSTTYSYGNSFGADQRWNSSDQDFIGTSSEFFSLAGDKETYGYLQAHAYVPDGTVSISNMGKAFSSAALPGSHAQASWYIFNHATSRYDDYFNARLHVTSVSVSALSAAVPEPATWAMMILGFGTVGAGMRLHRRQGRRAPALA